jgi:Flp pilus assembly protein TadG
VTISRRGRGPTGGRPAPIARAVTKRESRIDRGSVTAEFAVAMPAVILLLLAGLMAVSAVLTKLECVDAARQAARAAARGESGVAAGSRAAPPGAAVSVSARGGQVRATVRAAVRPLGAGLPGLTVSATAVAEPEPGVPG